MSVTTSKLGLAVVTGASTGIGAVYAERLAQRGYDLLLVARNAERLQSRAQALSQQYGVTCEVLVADLTHEADLVKVEQRLQQDAKITLLVNNAGMGLKGDVLESDIPQMTAMLALNITAPTRLALAAGNAFKARGTGTLINIASVLALIHEIANGIYNGSKSYILTFTRSLEASLKLHCVRVQAVLPGATRTEIFDRSGTPLEMVPPETVMEVETLVDAALAGLDKGESVTIASLEEIALWEEFDKARQAMLPYLSLQQSASRYR